MWSVRESPYLQQVGSAAIYQVRQDQGRKSVGVESKRPVVKMLSFYM